MYGKGAVILVHMEWTVLKNSSWLFQCYIQELITTKKHDSMFSQWKNQITLSYLDNTFFIFCPLLNGFLPQGLLFSLLDIRNLSDNALVEPLSLSGVKDVNYSHRPKQIHLGGLQTKIILVLHCSWVVNCIFPKKIHTDFLVLATNGLLS